MRRGRIQHKVYPDKRLAMQTSYSSTLLRIENGLAYTPMNTCSQHDCEESESTHYPK